MTTDELRLAVESRMHVFYLGPVSWMCLDSRIDVHLGTQTQFEPVLLKCHSVTHLATECR